MLTEKAIAICLLEVLKEYSDENHILSMGQIVGKINQLYGLNPDRRTIYSAIETLTELGYDISSFKDNGKGYYLIDKLLEKSEVHLLSDAICTFPFISEKQTSQLMKKIQSLVSIHERKQIKNLSVLRSDHKTVNKNVFYNIEILDEAIEKKIKKILEQLGLLNQCQNEWKKWQNENQECRFLITKQTECYCEVMDDEIKKLEKNRVMDKEYIRERISELTKVKNILFNSV